MKAILREHDGNHYVVKEVEFTNNNEIRCDGKNVDEINILTIIDKVESKYAICSACGEIMPNTKKAINAHRSAHDNYKGCYHCKYLRTIQTQNDKNKISFTLNDDGTFNRKINDAVNLSCGYYYGVNNITREDRTNMCFYRGCKTAAIKPCATFFDTYQNAFDNMITVDAIKDFKEVNEYRGYTKVKLKCRGNIYAMVNDKGIVDHFILSAYQAGTYYIYYSKKYNKFFIRNGNKYTEFNRLYNISTDRWDYIKETIAKLYN